MECPWLPEPKPSWWLSSICSEILKCGAASIKAWEQITASLLLFNSCSLPLLFCFKAKGSLVPKRCLLSTKLCQPLCWVLGPLRWKEHTSNSPQGCRNSRWAYKKMVNVTCHQEQQIQATIKSYYTPIRRTQIQTGAAGIPIHCSWECKVVQPLWKWVQLLTKLNTLLQYEPAVALLGIYPDKLETYVYTDTCTSCS